MARIVTLPGQAVDLQAAGIPSDAQVNQNYLLPNEVKVYEKDGVSIYDMDNRNFRLIVPDAMDTKWRYHFDTIGGRTPSFPTTRGWEWIFFKDPQTFGGLESVIGQNIPSLLKRRYENDQPALNEAPPKPPTMATRIYENVIANVSIYENKDTLEMSMPLTTETAYEAYFKQAGGTRLAPVEKDIVRWSFSKASEPALTLLNTITGQNLPSLYRANVPASPLPPGGDLMAMMQAASGVNIPRPESGPQLTESGFERKIIYKNDVAHCTVVDYSEYSVVLFCPAEWGRANSAALSQVAIYNQRMQNNPLDPTSKVPGWAFKKADEKAAAYLKTLTGEDIMAKATPPPAKKSYGGRGRGRGQPWGAQDPWAQPAWGTQPQASPWPNQGAMMAAAIPGIPGSGPALPSIPMGNLPGIPSGLTVPSTPVDLLNDVLNQLGKPMTEVKRQDLTDPSGMSIRVGFYGPKTQVDPMVSAYMTEFPTLTHGTGIEMDATVGPNRAVIVSRQQPTV